jgi:hypothetical protein
VVDSFISWLAWTGDAFMQNPPVMEVLPAHTKMCIIVDGRFGSRWNTWYGWSNWEQLFLTNQGYANFEPTANLASQNFGQCFACP